MAKACNELSWLYYKTDQYGLAEETALSALAFAHESEYRLGVKEANQMLNKIRGMKK